MHPFPAEMNAMMIRVLMKCPEDFHPACVNAIVNGEEAAFESALSNCGESEGQTSPWKNINPM
jgi:hypothetical protein